MKKYKGGGPMRAHIQHFRDIAFNITLSGEARNVCMRLNLKPIIIVFIQYLLKMCKLEMKDFDKIFKLQDYEFQRTDYQQKLVDVKKLPIL